MAKRVPLTFNDPDEDEGQTPEPAASTSDDKQAAPAKKSTKKKTTASKKLPAKKAPAKKAPAAKKSTTPRRRPNRAPAAKEQPVWATDEVTVRATDTKTAKPFNVALHPDDLQALDVARAMNGGDRQSRIRTMVAMWRGDPNYREEVEKRQHSAPRGGY